MAGQLRKDIRSGRGGSNHNIARQGIAARRRSRRLSRTVASSDQDRMRVSSFVSGAPVHETCAVNPIAGDPPEVVALAPSTRSSWSPCPVASSRLDQRVTPFMRHYRAYIRVPAPGRWRPMRGKATWLPPEGFEKRGYSRSHLMACISDVRQAAQDGGNNGGNNRDGQAIIYLCDIIDTPVADGVSARPR
jgi:hypothetical protein